MQTEDMSGLSNMLSHRHDSNSIKLCITCSPGGHWLEAERAAERLSCDRFYVTFYNPRLEQAARTKRVYFVMHARRNPFAQFWNMCQSLWILLRERPHIILSTGAGVTLPTCLLGKLLGAKLIFVESGGNVYTPSLTGRILYPFSDLFFVQWEPLAAHFPKAIYGGPLL